QSVSYENILARVDEGVSHLRHLARTLREASYVDSGWDARFREGWVQIVRDAGHAIENHDAEVEPIRDRLDRLAADLADERQLPSRSWPLYGSLIASMRHIAVIVDDVASARGARDGTAQNPSPGTAPSDCGLRPAQRHARADARDRTGRSRPRAGRHLGYWVPADERSSSRGAPGPRRRRGPRPSQRRGLGSAGCR